LGRGDLKVNCHCEESRLYRDDVAISFAIYLNNLELSIWEAMNVE
jgi:hypothetical protein